MRPQARTDIPTLLKNSDETELPMDPAYYRRLHDKIMMKIDDKERPEAGGPTPPIPITPRLMEVALRKNHSIR